jgi:hypothetical protein
MRVVVMPKSNLPRSARLLMRVTVLTGVLLPTAIALVAGVVLKLQGREVVGWCEAASMTALPTVFVVLPIYLLLAFAMYLLFSRTARSSVLRHERKWPRARW